MHGAARLGLERVRRLRELREEERVRLGEAPEKFVAGDGAARRPPLRRVRDVRVPDEFREQSRERQRRAVAHLRARRAVGDANARDAVSERRSAKGERWACAKPRPPAARMRKKKRAVSESRRRAARRGGARRRRDSRARSQSDISENGPRGTRTCCG